MKCSNTIIALLFAMLQSNVHCQDAPRMYAYNRPPMDAFEAQEKYQCSGQFEIFTPCNSSVSVPSLMFLLLLYAKPFKRG